jgi:hypothetical protein
MFSDCAMVHQQNMATEDGSRKKLRNEKGPNSSEEKRT